MQARVLPYAPVRGSERPPATGGRTSTRGIRQRGENNFQARAYIDGRMRSVGTFTTLEEAEEARVMATGGGAVLADAEAGGVASTVVVADKAPENSVTAQKRRKKDASEVRKLRRSELGKGIHLRHKAGHDDDGFAYVVRRERNGVCEYGGSCFFPDTAKAAVEVLNAREAPKPPLPTADELPPFVRAVWAAAGRGGGGKKRERVVRYRAYNKNWLYLGTYSFLEEAAAATEEVW